MSMDSTKRYTGFLCVAMVVGLVVVGLWPFAFGPINQVHWVEDPRGLQFRPDGIAFDPEPLPVVSQRTLPGEPASATVELWVEPDQEPHDDVHHILTIHNARLPSNLVLCQWKAEMLLRVPTRSKRGFREASVGGVLEKHHLELITLTCDPAGTSWYADGRLVSTSPGFTIPAGSLRGRLILGDSAEGKHGWNGRVHGLAVFDCALSADEVWEHAQAWTNHLAGKLAGETGLLALVTFDEGEGQWARDQSPHHHALLIPHRYRTLYKRVLPWPAKIRKEDVQDVWINIVGFVPFGFLVYWHHRLSTGGRRLRSAAVAVISGGAISFFIELTQVWLPNRYSSSADLVCNVLGSLLGVGIAVLVQSVAQRSFKA